MPKGYISNRQKNLKVGISSYTESNTVLEVTGKVGIGTANATVDLDVVGTVKATLFEGPLAGNADTSTYATSSGVSTSVSGGTASVTQLNVSGVSTFGGNVFLGDNDKVIFGDGNDLEIYHNGSNSYIDDNGTGNLVIRGTSQIVLQSIAGEDYGRFNNNGAVELYYDNNKKFETISTGVTITNDLYTSGNVSVAGTIFENFNGQLWNVVTQADVGYGASQVPLNQYLGQLAFLDDYHSNGLRRDGGGSDDLTVNSSGYVGIGTTNPVSKLHVSGGNITLENTASGPLDGPYIDLRETGFNDRFGIFADFGGIGDDNKLHFTANSSGSVPQTSDAKVTLLPSGSLLIGATSATGTASQRLQVTGGAYVSGNLGVGATNPGSTLHLKTTSGGTDLLLQTAAGSDNSITFAEDTQNYFRILHEGSAGTNPNNLFKIQCTDGADSVFDVDAITIKQSGDVGIGTDNPAEKLHVQGDIRIQTSLPEIKFKSPNGTSNQYYIGANISDVVNGGFIIGEGAAITGGTTKLAIDSTGNVTLNVSTGYNDEGYLKFGRADATDRSHFIRVYNDGVASGNYMKFDVHDGSFSTGGLADARTVLTLLGSGDVGIGTETPQYKLHVVGSFGATTKSFIIDHPTKEGKKLQYGSLEGPELGVYVRGRTQSSIIELPEYWTGLVDETSITVNLTPIGESATPRVKEVMNNQVVVFTKEEGELDYYYTVFAERKDVEKLEVEF